MVASSSKSPEDEAGDDKITKKGKMIAGLIALRSILDGFKTNDNPYFYYLKFEKEFKDKIGTSFQDYFYNKIEEQTVVGEQTVVTTRLELKTEFIEQKKLLESIESRRNYLERSFLGTNPQEDNYEKIKTFTQKLIAIEDFTNDENKNKFTELLTEDVVNIKNASGENLLNILYQFNEEAFKTALEKKPYLIDQITEEFTVNTETSSTTSSLIKKLAQQDFSRQNNKELLLDVLNKYKEKHISEQDLTGAKALVEMISKNNLLHHILSNNRDNADILDDVIKIVGSDATIEFNQNEETDGKTPLAIASERGHIKSVNLLLEQDAKPDIGDSKEWNSLHHACLKGHLKVVEALIEKEADLNKPNNNGVTPLYIACQEGHTEIVKALIEKEADFNKPNKNGVTPLFIACQNGHTDVVKTLIEKEADLNKPNNNGVTPLHIACIYGHTDVVKALLEKGAEINIPNINEATPLSSASKYGHTELVNLLVEKGADPNKNQSLLSIACQNGYTEIVKALLEKGAEINILDKKKETPLFKACKGGHTELVKLLLQNGADLNKNQSLLKIACTSPLYKYILIY